MIGVLIVLVLEIVFNKFQCVVFQFGFQLVLMLSGIESVMVGCVVLVIIVWIILVVVGVFVLGSLNISLLWICSSICICLRFIVVSVGFMWIIVCLMMLVLVFWIGVLIVVCLLFWCLVWFFELICGNYVLWLNSVFEQLCLCMVLSVWMM